MNLKKYFLVCLLITALFTDLQAQIEKVFVETYYISDAFDESDTTGGTLEAGSVTYRIYLDLSPGFRVKKIYGDINHPLRFSSSETFFNNISEGQTFAKDISKSRMYENTVALDSWITLGLVAKPASKAVGVPKQYDDDGSFIGGVNNDGGSSGIIYGLLNNSDPLAGIPLTINDGNDTLTIASGSWFDYGIISSNSDDSTIFGSIVSDSVFESYNCGLQYSGVAGVNPDSNYVLVAQLTTKGILNFEINVELIDSSGVTTNFVANDSILLAGEVWNRFLKFPYEPVCGCPDSTYLEYLSDRDCNSMDSCINLVVFGCMDIVACNYNSNANVNIPALCCYPGRCNDRDIAFVCPELNVEKNKLEMLLFPNPADEFLNISFQNQIPESGYVIINSCGVEVERGEIKFGEKNFKININSLSSGIYLFRLFNDTGSFSKSFIKE